MAIVDIGAEWARVAPHGSLVWDMIEKERGRYDWRNTDRFAVVAKKNGIRVFATVLPTSAIDGKKNGKGASLPNHMDWYLEFLEKAAE